MGLNDLHHICAKLSANYSSTDIHRLDRGKKHWLSYCVFSLTSLTYPTLKNHLSSIHLLFELQQFNIDLHQDFFIRLTLRGLKCLNGHTPASKLPITPQILLRLHSTIDFSNSLDLVFWTAALVAYFTFFRKSNLFPSSPSTFDPVRNLTRQDVQIIQSFALITVNRTKTIQFQERRLTIPIPRIPNSPLCPVSALERYYQSVPVSAAVRHPLSTYVQCGTLHSMTYPKFIQTLRLKWAALGLQPGLY